ncbi:GntR family transcriptional regulator [Leifsonia sp. RAF41]|uniref:GntR family transcriptional regulator n=1 Tax=Leifsonia sp. RAF41 TaxID=3233056 RepID=UPI003F97B86D
MSINMQTTRRSKRSTVDKAREDLLRLISQRELKPGDRLPTEPDLAEMSGVSRATIREALKQLEQSGLVHAIQGHGRFLTATSSLRVERPITKYESITEMLEGLGYRVENAVLGVKLSEANQKVAAALSLAEGASVIELTRLRYGDDQPLVFSVNYIPHAMLPGPVEYRDWSGAVTAALEMHGHRIVSSVARISAVNLPEPQRTRFQLAEYDPWLLVEETCQTAVGQRVLFAEDYHRGTEIGFNVLRRR